MAYTVRTTASAATDDSMALELRRAGSETQDATIELIAPVASEIISDNPTVIAGAVGAIDNAASTKLALAKCVHLEAGKWVWDGPNGASSTHYLIPDETGALIARATPFPFPSATAPELTW